VARCVRAALAALPADGEVVVYDDASTDGTPEIVAALAAEDGRVRLVRGGALPAGWVGKPHACHRLAAEARGDLLVYVDADVALEADGLARLASLLETYRADVVTAAPRQETVTFAERLVVPLLHLTYLSWLPLPLVWRSGDPRFLVANGQLLAVRRRTLDAAGGWAAVRAEVVDDMALCRRVKEAGGRVVFADGHRMARCRMYRGAAEVRDGFSKNLYEGVGGRPVALAGVVAAHAAVHLLPYAALAAALAGAPHLLLPALAGVGATTAMRVLLVARFGQPAEGIVLHPLSILALLGIALNSFRWTARGAIRWRGRTYAARAARGAP
jgi:chlorobactene glucosyltransferase